MVSEIIRGIKEATQTEKKAVQEDVRKIERVTPKIREKMSRERNDKWREELRVLNRLHEEGIPVPTLSVCGRGTREIRFTKLLGYFFDPNCLHGLGNKFFQEFLRIPAVRENIPSDFPDNPSDHYQVKEEKKLNTTSTEPSCFVDIAIFRKEEFTILIEQKILSPESVHPESDLSQLERYDRAISANEELSDSSIMKVFLTPESKDGIRDWIALSHVNLIEAGLKILKEGSLNQIQRMNLKALLLDLAFGPYQKRSNKLFRLAREVTDEKEKNEEVSVDFILRKELEIKEFEIVLNIIKGDDNFNEDEETG